MFHKLLTKIHDSNISLDHIITCLQATLGQSAVRSVIGAGLIHVQQLSDINTEEVISRIEKIDCKHKNNTTNVAHTSIPANIFSHQVLNNKDLCYRILSHCNGQEINRHITLINKYFNSICNSPQTYQNIQYSKSIVGKGHVNRSTTQQSQDTNLNQTNWNDISIDIITDVQYPPYTQAKF